MANLHERRYNHGIDRLRNPKRLAMLEVNRVNHLLLENLPQATGFLDIGTGSGVFAQKLAAPGLSVTARCKPAHAADGKELCSGCSAEPGNRRKPAI